MRHLKTILSELNLKLTDTQKAIIASIAISPTEKMAYGVITGALNSTTSAEILINNDYIRINYESKTAQLTQLGQDVLTSENLVDDNGELTDRGAKLVARYRENKQDWQQLD